ncbi:hypothetical protein MZE24_19255, partial [Bacillus amyloliquefaciens]|uniref:hypothetical protein n=1 Tax=Bacillus amyloliquefaciens TaxID=1390 RepID=UPI00211A8ECA
AATEAAFCRAERVTLVGYTCATTGFLYHALFNFQQTTTTSRGFTTSSIIKLWFVLVGFAKELNSPRLPYIRFFPFLVFAYAWFFP